MLRRILVLASGVLLAATLTAQETGQLAGTVTSGAGPVSGAEVRVSRAGTSDPAATSSTSGDGRFRLTGLPQAVYRVTVTREGYRPVERTGIVVLAGATAGLDLTLEPVATGQPDEVRVRLVTPLGVIEIAVDVKRAPVTSANFLRYVDAGLYDNGRFHRATRPDNYTPAPPDRPMMELIQAGIDPSRRSQGFPPIALERTSVTGLRHVAGTVSMARGTGADTATSDFFILLDDQPSLDFGGRRFEDAQGAAAFGRVTADLEVVRLIQGRPVTGQNLTPPVPIDRALRVTREER
jgi:peptidyl-prolyl cis-trans isomerase A (cyclophilin A)